MTFVLYPLSHYNSITEPHARFLLSLLEDLSIDFPSHFILFLINVYRDTATHDNLIFPSTITQIIRHFSISILDSHLFTVMDAINLVSVRRSEAQLRLKRTRTERMDSSAPSIPSTSAPFSSSGDVMLEAIIAQLWCMDACLDTLSDELCQVTTRVGRITRWQARLGDFIASPSPSLEASEEEDADDGTSDDDDDEDEEVSSSSDEEMTISQ